MSQDDCLPELTNEQFAFLCEDIRLRGVQTPVEICANSNEILDGRARVRACKILKVSTYPRRIVGGLDSEESRRHHRLKSNCLRRQLDRPAFKEVVLAEMRRKAQSDRSLSGIFGVSHSTIAAWRRDFCSTGRLRPAKEFLGQNGKTYRPSSIFSTTTNSANKAAKLLNELGDYTSGRTLTSRAASELVHQKRRERADARVVALPSRVTLHQGRFQSVGSRIRDGSVDIIFTDPLYSKEWVDQGQWGDLARFAERVLRPQGLLCTYAGVAYLDRVMQDLGSGGLDYIWTVAVRGSGFTSRLWNKNVINKWKPILIYGKGVRRLPSAVFDLLEGSGREKSRHEFEQNEQDCEYYLSHLVPRGALVLDCCCGSGTTLAVARRLGMRAVGIDEDPGAIALTKERLGESRSTRKDLAKVAAGRGSG